MIRTYKRGGSSITGGWATKRNNQNELEHLQFQIAVANTPSILDERAAMVEFRDIQLSEDCDLSTDEIGDILDTFETWVERVEALKEFLLLCLCGNNPKLENCEVCKDCK